MIQRDDAAIGALLERCARKDGAALAELYSHTSAHLLGSLMRILRRRALAEEALQDVFVAVWQRAGQFDEYRGRAGAWLVSIARYRAIDILRRERLTPAEPAEMEVLASACEGGADADLHDTAALDYAAPAAALERCIGALGAGERESIHLAYLDGLSHNEVAVRMGRPLGTVKSWIRRGLAALKDCLTLCATEAKA